MYDFDMIRHLFQHAEFSELTSEHGERILKIESPMNFTALIWERGLIEWHGYVWLQLLADLSECWVAEPVTI
jgi:hypothetical protein